MLNVEKLSLALCQCGGICAALQERKSELMTTGKMPEGKPAAGSSVSLRRALAWHRLTVGIVGALLCWHAGATTEGALKVSYSSNAVKWISTPAGTRINFLVYFPMMSVSRLTTDPALRKGSTVSLIVCGMIETLNDIIGKRENADFYPRIQDPDGKNRTCRGGLDAHRCSQEW